MLNNKTIYDAMTIKLTAEDIPMEIPKLDPSIRRAPKRIVKHKNKYDKSILIAFFIFPPS